MSVPDGQSDRKTVFLHVPKTGGNTFQTILKLVYGSRFHVSLDASIASTEAALRQYDAVEFHLMPGGNHWSILHEEIVRQSRWDLLAGKDIFAMLRDPVDHYVSQYFFVAKLRDRIEPMMRRNGERFPDSLEEAIENPATLNNQLAYLAAKTQLGGNYVGPADLAEVKKWLVDLDVHVGLTERFSDSLNVFENVTGRRIPGSVIHSKNRNDGRPKLEAVTDKARERIRELSALDVELYEFGRELFARDIARYGAPAREYSFVSSTYSTKGLVKAAGEAAKRAADWLVAQQLADGAFKTEVCVTRGKGGEIADDLAPASCPFTTAQVLYSMQSARKLKPGISDAATGAGIDAATRHGLAFLKSEMIPGGLWRFWSRKGPKAMALPPDLDDTSTISHLLKAHGVAIPDNRGIFFDSRDPQGAFYTWLYKSDSWSKKFISLRTAGRAFQHRARVNDLDAVCSVVNANVLAYLGEIPETRGAIEYLLQIFKDGREEESIRFYEHRMSLYYAASRAFLHGCTAFAGVKAYMGDRIAGFQVPNDSFGNELVTAQAICALLNLGERHDVLGRAVEYLLGVQHEDGSWNRVSMYGGMHSPVGYGSAEMTTAICLEALARYSVAEKLA